MNWMDWALLELGSYSLANWLTFVAITLVASYLGRGWGILAGQILVAIAVAWLDVQWIQSEMAAPGWDGVPDQDIIFEIGIVMRVVLINTVLLPVGLASRWLSLRKTKRTSQPVA